MSGPSDAFPADYVRPAAERTAEQWRRDDAREAVELHEQLDEEGRFAEDAPESESKRGDRFKPGGGERE